MKRLVLIFLFMSAIAYGIDIRTNIANVYHDGCCERIGSFSMVVSEDAFSHASSSTPIYIRFRILRARGWGCTLVDLRPHMNSPANVPINLALHCDGDLTLNPALPANAVQLVRLIKGEKDGWIKVNYPSLLWLTDGANFMPPDYHNMVSFSVGLRAYASVRPDGSTPTMGNEFADGSGLADTELVADYSGTPGFNPGDIDVLDFIAFNDDTVGVETDDQVIPGTNAGVTFSNDNQIARGELHVARFEFHLQHDQYDSPPHTVPLNRLNSVDVWNWCGEIPPLFFTNTGDFDWQPGTVISLCSLNEEITNSNPQDELRAKTRLEAFLNDEANILVTSDPAASWSVKRSYHDEQFTGYEFRLESGVLEPNETVTVAGLTGCMNNDLKSVSLNLMAYAYIYHELITDGELFELGPRIREAVSFVQVEDDYYRQVIPFTAYDRPSWEYETLIVNRGTHDAHVTSILFNRHGIALRVEGLQDIPVNGQHRLSIPELFGLQAESVLSWIEILCDQPFSSVGIIQDENDMVFDAFLGVDEFQETLYAVHVPSLFEVWETAAYILSSDLSMDTQFYLQLAGHAPDQIKAILIPGSTAMLNDDVFGTDAMRSEWFQVNATYPAGSGLILYSKKLGNGQLASVSMNLTPSPVWTFDHLGNAHAGWWSGLVLVNPEDTPVDLQLIAYDANHQIVSETSQELDAFEKSILTEQVFAGDGVSVVSRLEIEGTGNLLALLLTGLDSQDMLTGITGNLQASKQLTLPYLPRGGDDWIGISVVNPSQAAASVILTVYTDKGEAGPSVTFSLPAEGKELFLLSDLIGPFSAYSHAALSSNVAIRAMALSGNRDHTKLATINLTP